MCMKTILLFCTYINFYYNLITSLHLFQEMNKREKKKKSIHVRIPFKLTYLAVCLTSTPIISDVKFKTMTHRPIY